MMTMEESFLETYSKDVSFLATQQFIIDAITKDEKKQKGETDLQPFEYFLLRNPAFVQGYAVNAHNVLVKEIAKKTNNTTSLLKVDSHFSQRVLTNQAIEIYTHSNAIVDVGAPVYHDNTVVGAVVLSFSLPITKVQYTNALTQKKMKDLENDLFNRKEFIYTITVVGIIFICISIALCGVYLHMRTRYSFFSKVDNKYEREEETSKDDDIL